MRREMCRCCRLLIGCLLCSPGIGWPVFVQRHDPPKRCKIPSLPSCLSKEHTVVSTYQVRKLRLTAFARGSRFPNAIARKKNMVSQPHFARGSIIKKTEAGWLYCPWCMRVLHFFSRTLMHWSLSSVQEICKTCRRWCVQFCAFPSFYTLDLRNAPP